MESIKEFGFKVPIIIDKNNVIVAGHTRLKAAKKLKMTEVPCIVADDLTEEQIKAFRLADNKVSELAEWDMELLSQELEAISELDISKFGFEEIEQEKDPDEIVEDEPPAPPINPKSKQGDVYQLGKHRLMCGDSTKAEDVEKLMNGEKADMVVTDPPYNVSYEELSGNISEYEQRKKKHRSLTRTYNKIENDKMNKSQFREFLCSAYTQMKASLKKGGAFYIWYANRESENFYGALHDVGLENRETVIWVKNTLALGMQDYQHRDEPCIYGWNSGAAHYFRDTRKETTVFDNSKDIKSKSKEELVDILSKIYEQSNIIYEDKPRVSDLHPTMKPIKLISRLILNSSKQGELVLDLFGGSGSTLIAAEQMNRRCYMMEYDPQYVDVIIERWENLTGEKAVKLND